LRLGFFVVQSVFIRVHPWFKIRPEIKGIKPISDRYRPKTVTHATPQEEVYSEEPKIKALPGYTSNG
jgi:hypothetical protein